MKHSNKGMTEFTIDFKKWGKELLLNSFDGTMCCLGFCGIKAGYKKNDLMDFAAPVDVVAEKWPTVEAEKWPTWILETEDANRLMEINDSDHSDSLRMAAITKIFKKHHITVKWKNVPRSTLKEYERFMENSKAFAKEKEIQGMKE